MRDLLRQKICAQVCAKPRECFGLFWYCYSIGRSISERYQCLHEFANFHPPSANTILAEGRWAARQHEVFVAECWATVKAAQYRREPQMKKKIERKEIDIDHLRLSVQDWSDWPGETAFDKRLQTSANKSCHHLSPLPPTVSLLSTLDNRKKSGDMWNLGWPSDALHNRMDNMNLNDGTKMREQLDSPLELPRCCLKTVHQCHCLLSLYRWGRSLTAELQKRLTLKHVKSKWEHI